MVLRDDTRMQKGVSSYECTFDGGLNYLGNEIKYSIEATNHIRRLYPSDRKCER